jgi:hypothetical protein
MNTPATMIATASPTRRSRRDWVVDTLLFLVAVVFGLLVIGGQLEAAAPPVPTWLLTADVIAGALSCAGLWLRRRRPVGLAERVALASGRLEHGPTAGGWRLAAWLPWPA